MVGGVSEFPRDFGRLRVVSELDILFRGEQEKDVKSSLCRGIHYMAQDATSFSSFSPGFAYIAKPFFYNKALQVDAWRAAENRAYS